MNIWQAGLSTPLVQYLQNPADIEAIQDIYRCYAKDEKIQKAVAKILLADPGFKALYESWYLPQKFTLDQLLTLPRASFGYHYASHMRRYGLKLDFIGEFEGKDILSYLWCRAGHVHDIAHMILGYDISFLGEAAVKGFELAQYLSPATAAILGGGLLSVSSLQPEALGPMLEITFEGYRAGKLYPLLVGLKWDLEWETPLRDLMIKFNLPQRRAVEGGQMLWST